MISRSKLIGSISDETNETFRSIKDFYLGRIGVFLTTCVNNTDSFLVVV